MNKQYRIYFVAFFLLALLVFPAISMPISTSKAPSTNTIKGNQETHKMKNTSLPSFSQPTPTPTVKLERTNITGSMDIWYDSVVEIKNAYLGEFGALHYYLYNNSVLILDNVTFSYKVMFHLYDSATLIIKNSNDNSEDNTIYPHDESRVYIYNSSFKDSDITSRENASVYLYNTSIDFILIYDNSSFVAENVSVDYMTYVFDFAQATFRNTVFHQKIVGNGNASITIEDSKSDSNVELYSNATLLLKNSTINNLLEDPGFSKAAIINSTISQITSQSALVTEVYNSTITTIKRGFIINGVGTYKNDILEMISGTFQYNVINDSDTVANSIHNMTAFSVLQNAKLTITQITAQIVSVFSFDATLFINSSTNVLTIQGLASSKVTIFNSILSFVEIYDSQMSLNKTTSNSITIYRTTMELTNTSINTLYVRDNSVVRGSNYVVTTLLRVDYSSLSGSNVTAMNSVYGYNATMNISYGFLNKTTVYFVNTSITTSEVNWSSADIYTTRTSFTAEGCQMTTIQIDTYDTVLRFSNCTGTSSSIELDVASASIINSTLGDIKLYRNSTAYIQKNSTIHLIYVALDANALVNISDSNITRIEATSLSSQVFAYNSEIQKVFYTVQIFGGIVNVTDNKITSSSSNVYNTTFIYDDKTNVTNFYLDALFVDSATVHITNQTVSSLIYMTNTEAYIYNVTAYKLSFSGSALHINQFTASYVFISQTSHTTLDINGTIVNTLYTGFGFNTTYDTEYLTQGAVYGNITFSEFTNLAIYDGVVYVSNVTTRYILGGAFAKVYLYNTTILNGMYQTYIFTHDGEVNNANVLGYTDVGVLNVSGNIISGVLIGFLVNLNGTLTVNSSEGLIVGYNSSITRVYNTTVYGFELHDSAIAYFNNSEVDFTYFAPDILMDYSKLYVNSTPMNIIAMYNQSYFEGFNITFFGNSYFAITSTIELHGSSKMVIQNATLTTYSPRVVTVTDTAVFLAKNVSLNSNIDVIALYTSGSARVSWNESVFMMDPYLPTVTIMEFYDHSDVSFRDIFLNVTAPSNTLACINLYNSSRFTATNFNFSDVTSDYTGIFAYDFSVLTFNNVSFSRLIGIGNSSWTIYNSWISFSVEMYDNATGTIQNDHYNAHMTKYLFVTGENTELTVTNTTVYYALVSGTLYLYDVSNSSAYLNIKVEEQGRLFADNLTATKIDISYEEPEYPYPMSVLNNTKTDKLIISVTTHKTGDINFTGTTFTANPSSSLFEHVTLNNVTATEKRLCLNIKDNTRVNGTDAEIEYLYVAFIIDTTSPTVSVSPSALSFESGLPNQQVAFTICEDFPDMYVVTRNGTIIASGHYDNGSIITVDVSAFGAGTWELVLTANDTSGNSASATSTIIVYPSEAPVFTAKPPRTYEMTNGSSGNVLNWTATDRTPAFYEIYVNGTLKVNGTWSSGTPIEYNIDTFDMGTYNVTIVLHDEAGNQAKDTVTVVVSAQGGIPEIGLPGLEGIPLEYIIIGVVVLLLAIAAVIIARKRKGKKTQPKTKSERKTKSSRKKKKT